MAEPEKITPIHPLTAFARRWRRQQLLRQALLALMAGAVLFFGLLLLYPLLLALAGGLLLAGGVLLLLLWLHPPRSITEATTAAWLDWQHPALQHSSSLLLQQPENLPLPARLQRAYVGRQLDTLLPKQKPPVPLALPLVSLAVVLLGGGLLLGLWQPADRSAETSFSEASLPVPEAAKAQAAELKRQLPELREGRLRLAPPAYTRLPAGFHLLSDLEAPEGSRITWQLQFNKEVQQVYLTDQKNDTLRFQQTTRGNWTAQLEATQPLFYRIGYATATDTAFSAYLKITLLPDEAPRPRILAPEQYLLEQAGDPFAVSVEATDDYGLEDVYLSLTISRGSGEGVSFRNEKVWIKTPSGAKAVKEQLQLTPRSLKMQPGDELYYRLEAFDNKPPCGQQRRSNTWYYQWKDTAQAVSELSSGLALDREPEYFRSQRQIIIDTEKLISTQKTTPVARWEKANQDLAVDQKLLRLRYGKFLGEEFESSAGGYGAGHEEEEEEGEHTDDDGHDHDHDHDRHETTLPGHEAPAGAAPAAGLMHLFGHAHDTEEGATFYEESIKVKLRAALSEMWQAELHLRLSQPRLALPYEYRALLLIKEVQQSSRIYVERVGLELPTLIPAEHRLKGDQDKILPENRQGMVAAGDSLQATRQLLARLSFWERGESLDAATRQLVLQSSREVARLMVDGGPYMPYFYLLNSLNVLHEQASTPAAEVYRVQQGLYRLLPRQQLPTQPPLPPQGGQQSFLRHLKPQSR
jgi:hypothetical protein